MPELSETEKVEGAVSVSPHPVPTITTIKLNTIGRIAPPFLSSFDPKPRYLITF